MASAIGLPKRAHGADLARVKIEIGFIGFIGFIGCGTGATS